MKAFFVTLLLGISAALTGCATGPQGSATRNQQLYDSESEKVGNMVKSGAISRREANIEMVSITRTYFPNDPLLISTWGEIAELSAQEEQGLLTREKYTAMVNLRWERFEKANRLRHDAAQEKVAQQNSSAFMGNFLSNMANSMNRQYPRPITCSSTSMPGVITTNCQ